MQVNKKLWSFIFGCLIAGSFVWLISLAKSVSVPDFLHPYPDFIIDYYAASVTSVMAVLLTISMIIIMGKVFKVCASEHPFWLALPSITFVFLTLFASSLMLRSMLSAAVPALIIMSLTAIFFRLVKVKKLKES